MEERVQKILSRMGFGSRRQCEMLITEGRVLINGVKAELGSKADPAADKIVVDGSKLDYEEPEKVYIALNKPRFVLCDRPTNDPRQTVYSLVPDSDGLFVVGRLDFESEGLVLMTNDGELANKLSHPRYGKEKEYKVLLAKRPDDDQLNKWRRGVVLEDGEKTAPADVRLIRYQGDGAWVRVIMKEGRKREIREIGKQIGLPIVKLVRVRIGTLMLGTLKPKEWIFLKDEDVQKLRDLVSGKLKPASGAPVIRKKTNSRSTRAGVPRKRTGGGAAAARPARKKDTRA